MKRLAIVLITIVWLLLMAYASALTGPRSAVPGPRPTPRIPNYAYYTKRCWPACHYDPKKMSEEPHSYLHDFEDGLPAGWQWMNEDPTHWTLTEVPGALRIVSQEGSISGDLRGAANALVGDIPAGHFDIVTRLTFDPTADSQNAAILIRMDDAHVISLGRGYCRKEEDTSCVGSGIYFDGSDLGCARIGVPTTEEQVYLMLRRAGNSYIGYYGLGDKWVEIGRCYNEKMKPTMVGLAAANSGPGVPEIPADFERLSVVERP